MTEHTVLLILALLRQLTVAQANVCAGILGAPLGRTLAGRMVRLNGLVARLIGITRQPDAAKSAEFLVDECFSSSDRGRALVQTDALVLRVRLAHQTRGLIDYRALCNALASGHLAGVGLDVFWTEPITPDDPVLKFPNVIATPHVAGVTDRSYADIADAVASNIERLRSGEPPLNQQERSAFSYGIRAPSGSLSPPLSAALGVPSLYLARVDPHFEKAKEICIANWFLATRGDNRIFDPGQTSRLTRYAPSHLSLRASHTPSRLTHVI